MVSVTSVVSRSATFSAPTHVSLLQMTSGQIDALDARTLQTANASGMTAQQIGALKPATVAKFSKTQIGQFSAAQVQALTAPQLAGLSAPALQSIAIGKLSPAQIAALDPATASRMSAAQINAMTPAQTRALSSNDISALSALLVAALNIAQMNVSQVAKMSATTISRLSAAQLNAMNKADFQALDVTALTASQLSGLSGTAAANFSAAQIMTLSPTQTSKLSAAAAKTLLAVSATTLSSSQINAFTATQLSGDSVVVGTAGGLSFKLLWDASAKGAAPAMKNAAIHAAANLSGQIANNVQVSVTVSYGRVGNQKISSSAVASSMAAVAGYFSYSDIRAAIASNAAKSAIQKTIAAQLPGADPTHGGSFLVSSAQAKALGLQPKYSAPFDGYAGLSSALPMDFTGNGAAGKFNAVAAFEHEFTEVMGRVGSLGLQQGAGVYTTLDLFHYSENKTASGAAGAPFLDLAPSSNGANVSYFSVDGGKTAMALYGAASPDGRGGDFADFATSSDPYGGGAPGAAPALSGADAAQMAAVGWNMTSAAVDLVAKSVAIAYFMA